jgi:RNA polymerase sigma-70 factor (ECF subfamily)
MGNPHDAADGLQDGLVAAYRRADSFRGEAAVTTWLHRVVVNACLDRIRAARVRRADSLPDDLDEYRDRGSVFTSTAPVEDPEAVAVGSERRRAVLAALATLPAEQRAALVLVDMEGYPVSEVAVILGCAEGTVKSRCARGRERLARLLRDRLADAPPPGVAPVRDRGHPEPGAGPPRPIPTSPTDPRPAPGGGGP